MQHLLVGGAGFIGTSLLRRLGEAGTVVFDNLSPIVHDSASVRAFAELGCEFVVGDVSVREDVDNLLEEHGTPETLVYLAAETGTGRSLLNCSLNARVNTLGLATMLDALSARGEMPKRIILSSTRAVYGEGPYKHPDGRIAFPEQRSLIDLDSGRFEYEGIEPLDMDAIKHPPKPNNIYGSTKLSQEHLLESWAAAFDVPLYIFRLQNVYGAGQSLTNPYTGVLIHFIKQSLLGEPVSIFENGGITRDFVHVSDVASLLALAANGQGRPGRYDCGSGERIDLEDVAAKLAAYGKAPKPVRSAQYRRGDVRHACAAINRSIDAFEWSPQVSLDEGLSALYDFVRHRLD
ncbi:MAG: NAD-dependent epimerase/dehydratase family protein [Paracoccaceae bacterium]